MTTCAVCGAGGCACGAGYPAQHIISLEVIPMADNKRVAAQRLYLTKDNRIVGDDDPEKHVLLAAAGTTVSDEQLALLNISAEAFDAANVAPSDEETDAEQQGADANADNAQRTGGEVEQKLGSGPTQNKKRQASSDSVK